MSALICQVYCFLILTYNSIASVTAHLRLLYFQYQQFLIRFTFFLSKHLLIKDILLNTMLAKITPNKTILEITVLDSTVYIVTNQSASK